MPQPLARWFALSLPCVEAGLGFLLMLGFWTRFALVGGSCLILSLVFGTALRSDWETVGIQMLYAVIYYLLLAGRAHNRFSVDRIRDAQRAR
jgi:thiosulfate dehydrogenase (quinone) large subunit